ncbi:MAG: lipoprotein insertase outer membrane protein LolB [Gammaproteobacteria bacterium]|nr:lipoprotein insertase outer membrane protein LolB [Gammaproteobacteria bacterium]
MDIGPDADFRLRGKIGVRYGNDVRRGFSATFDWVQAGDGYVIELWGPLGQGRTRLTGDGGRLTVTDGSGSSLTDVDPEALMEAQLGWSAPVDVLRHWILGRPAPDHGVDASLRDADGNLARFEQLDWIVDLSRWRSTASRRLPGKVTATREHRRITVICHEWSFPSADPAAA